MVKTLQITKSYQSLAHKATLILSFLAIMSALALATTRAVAQGDSIVNLTVNVPSVCSLSIDDDEHTISMLPGTSRTIGVSTIKAICNDPNGLAVYSVGYTGEIYGNNRLAANINDQDYYIESHATASGTPATSEWNMTLTPVPGDYTPEIVNVTTGENPVGNFAAPHAIPTTYTKVAYRNSSTDVDSSGYTAVGANFTAQFDIYAAPNQIAGTYVGKVKFLLVHPVDQAAPETPVATSGQICYYGNGADSGSMACQTTIDTNNSTTALSANAKAQLRAPNFSRAGFGFTGWNTKEDGTGTQYGPMETITFTEDMNTNGLVLFAIWQAAETGVTMQTFNAAAFEAANPTKTVIALKDTRDNDVYAVAKLADGKWWMIENLRLDYNADITTSNTQSNNGNWGGAFAGLAGPEIANFSNSTTANSLYSTTNITGSNQGYRFPRYNSSNTTNRVAELSSINSNVYSYGNYYSWPAAIANTNNYETRNQSVSNSSLCPSGWHLPTGGDKSNEANNESWNLIVNGIMNGVKPSNYASETNPYYSGSSYSIKLREYPNNYVFSGYYYDASFTGRGMNGCYWTNTVNTYDSAFGQYLFATGVRPGTYPYPKPIGATVRCLAD